MYQTPMATYELMRTTVLSTFLSHPQAVSRAYAFAWYHRMPGLGFSAHETHFFGFHKIDQHQVTSVIDLIAKLSGKKQWNSLAFDKMVSRVKVTPAVYTTIIKYLSLSGQIEGEVYNAVCEGCSVDLMDFGTDDIRFPS